MKTPVMCGFFYNLMVEVSMNSIQKFASFIVFTFGTSICTPVDDWIVEVSTYYYLIISFAKLFTYVVKLCAYFIMFTLQTVWRPVNSAKYKVVLFGYIHFQNNTRSRTVYICIIYNMFGFITIFYSLKVCHYQSNKNPKACQLAVLKIK